MTIQGRNTSFFIKTLRNEIRIPADKINEEEIKSFAIRNDITCQHEEGYHGGYTEVIHQSSSSKVHEK